MGLAEASFPLETNMKFSVEGMTCGHCVRAITRAVKALDPDATIDVDLAGGTVAIHGGMDDGLAAAAIEGEGYRVVAPKDAPPATAACCGGCKA